MGDVFVFDPTNLEASQWRPEGQIYQQKIDVSAAETPYLTSLDNG